jgi:hypothetical protein
MAFFDQGVPGRSGGGRGEADPALWLRRIVAAPQMNRHRGRQRGNRFYPNAGILLQLIVDVSFLFLRGTVVALALEVLVCGRLEFGRGLGKTANWLWLVEKVCESKSGPLEVKVWLGQARSRLPAVG